MFLQFLAEQWLLVSALVACLMLLLFHEGRRGGPALTPYQAVALINQKEAAVVDLRDPAEYRKGHIVGAINLPFAKLAERWGELEALRDKPIVLVCKLGQTASSVGKQMRGKGFTEVYRLGGGLVEWDGLHMPLVKE